MIEQKIIFTCDHIISILRRKAALFVLTRAANSDFDEITNNGSISEILYIYEQLEDKTVKSYTQYKDFIKDNNNIKWLTANRPSDGKNYYCEAMHNFRYIQNYAENPKLCERCFGMGWYVSPISTNYKKLESAKGIGKMVQDYIKILYTEIGDDGYGTKILSYVGSEVRDENIFLSEISMELNSAASQLQAIQEEILKADGAYIDESEILSEIQIESMEYDKEDMAVYVSMILVSVSGKTAALSFKF